MPVRCLLCYMHVNWITTVFNSEKCMDASVLWLPFISQLHRVQCTSWVRLCRARWMPCSLLFVSSCITDRSCPWSVLLLTGKSPKSRKICWIYRAVTSSWIALWAVLFLHTWIFPHLWKIFLCVRNTIYLCLSFS